MQAEYQSPSRGAAAIEDSYSYIETVSGSSAWTRRREEFPSDLSATGWSSVASMSF